MLQQGILAGYAVALDYLLDGPVPVVPPLHAPSFGCIFMPIAE